MLTSKQNYIAKEIKSSLDEYEQGTESHDAIQDLAYNLAPIVFLEEDEYGNFQANESSTEEQNAFLSACGITSLFDE